MSGITPGRHTIALIGDDDDGSINLDNIVLVNGSPLLPGGEPGQEQPTSEDNGSTADASNTRMVNCPQGSKLSILTESQSSGPIQIVLIDPLGQTFGVVTSTNGHANLDTAVPMPGLYTVKVISSPLSPASFYRAITPVFPH